MMKMISFSLLTDGALAIRHVYAVLYLLLEFLHQKKNWFHMRVHCVEVHVQLHALKLKEASSVSEGPPKAAYIA